MQRALFPKDGLPKHLRDDFEIFWEAYPARKPNPRALAEVAYARAVKDGAAPDDLARAAAGYAAEVKAQSIYAAFVVHAATFLRQRRYLDYLHAAPAAEQASTSRPLDRFHPLYAAIRGAVSDAEFIAWIQPLEIVSCTDHGYAMLHAPTRFHRDWVRQHYADVLRRAPTRGWITCFRNSSGLLKLGG
ncbi:MAG: DnaA N-terminal domain-containing protein [Acetobacteraceae bacterium]